MAGKEEGMEGRAEGGGGGRGGARNEWGGQGWEEVGDGRKEERK